MSKYKGTKMFNRKVTTDIDWKVPAVKLASLTDMTAFVLASYYISSGRIQKDFTVYMHILISIPNVGLTHYGMGLNKDTMVKLDSDTLVIPGSFNIESKYKSDSENTAVEPDITVMPSRIHRVVDGQFQKGDVWSSTLPSLAGMYFEVNEYNIGKTIESNKDYIVYRKNDVARKIVYRRNDINLGLTKMGPNTIEVPKGYYRVRLGLSQPGDYFVTKESENTAYYWTGVDVDDVDKIATSFYFLIRKEVSDVQPEKKEIDTDDVNISSANKKIKISRPGKNQYDIPKGYYRVLSSMYNSKALNGDLFISKSKPDAIYWHEVSKIELGLSSELFLFLIRKEKKIDSTQQLSPSEPDMVERKENKVVIPDGYFQVEEGITREDDYYLNNPDLTMNKSRLAKWYHIKNLQSSNFNIFVKDLYFIIRKIDTSLCV
jgi:hypothetical protein